MEKSERRGDPTVIDRALGLEGKVKRCVRSILIRVQLLIKGEISNNNKCGDTYKHRNAVIKPQKK